MNKLRISIVFTPVMLLLVWNSYAQDFECVVKIEARQIETSDRRIFDEMEVEFAKFLNDRKWSEDRIEPEEKIRCGFNINLQSQPSIGNFTASVQVVSVRPVYGSIYESTLINFADREFNFEYTLSQPLDYNDNTYISNITSMLAFYAYIVLGYDYDSFEKNAGDVYFNKAWQVVQNAQQSGYSGWDQFNSVRNRYFFAEGAIDQIMKPLREAIYDYHIRGLDIMLEKPDEGRANILEALKKVHAVNRSKPRSIFVIAFLDAKVDELVSVFSEGNMSERRQAFNLLKDLDPARSDTFQKILDN